MFRLAFVLLIITNLILCPLRCRECLADDATGVKTATATDGCSCCSAPAIPTTPDEPLNPLHRDDCQCQDCVCEGAVVSSKVEPPCSTDGCLEWLGPNHGIQTLSRATLPLRTRDLASASLFLNGRNARIAFQSLLN